jgi:hypothetical protein
MQLTTTSSWLFLAGILLFSCAKEPVNPYDQIEDPNQETEEETELDPTSIMGLHANVFRPTCANSGCHDGTFEPDFRTVQSTYNTLVNQPIIKNDPQGTFSYRVVPGNVAASQLVARLEYDIDGTSGVMPLAVEPDSDWPVKRQEYIQHLKDWIAAGAPDPSGN